MTREEICENLKTIITQIDETTGNRYEGINSTYIADIKPNSLRFVIEEAIKALQDKGRDRKKAKRFKNKYLKLKTAMGKIKAEIVEERNRYSPSEDEYKAINKVLQIIDKHIGSKG